MDHASGIAAGILADRLIKDPQRYHPVALFGQYALWWERRLYRDNKVAGAVFAAACVLPPTLVAAGVAKRAPWLATAVALWAALGGTSLECTGMRMAQALESGDEDAARSWVPWLCSRDPELLDAPGMARAAVESVAENTSDAAIAPLVWAAVAGAPGVVAHRCVNTLDAMVGYCNERYRNFGWAAAKLDDAMAWVPARLTAVVHTGFAALHGRGAAALRAWRDDAPSHPSPNAGPVEATAAAALGVRLGGPTAYAHGVEKRPYLGEGPEPTVQTVREAVRLSRCTQLAVGAMAYVFKSTSSQVLKG